MLLDAKNKGQKKLTEKNWFRWLILVIFTLCITAGSLGLNSVPSLGPIIKQTMNLSAVEVGALMASFYIGTTIMAFSYSFYFDRFSVKHALAGGLLIIGGFVLIAGARLNFLWIMFFLAIAGSGYGIINPAINKGIVAWFPEKIRGTAMSLKQIGVMLGSVVSAAILPSIAVHTSVGFALMAAGASTVAVGVISYFVYKEKSLSPKSTNLENQAAGIRIILTDRNLALCNIVSMLFVGAQFSFFMYLSLYMRDEFHFDVIEAGIILSFASVGGVLGRVAWGLISDFLFHSERKNILVFIGFSSTLFGLMLAWMPMGISVYLIYGLVICYGMTIGGWNGIIQAMVVELAEPKLAGIISGITLSFIYLGTLVLPFLFGVTVEETGNYRLSWTVSACSVLVASVLLMKVRLKESFKVKNNC
jgi:ACS family hexuronate transporter-like MFS transporter